MKTVTELAEVSKLEIKEGDILVVRVEAESRTWVDGIDDSMAHITQSIPDGVAIIFLDKRTELSSNPTGAELIHAERLRQIQVKGFGPENDAAWVEDEMARAAAYYATPDHLEIWTVPYIEGFSKVVNSKSDRSRIHQLVIAGALIAAEIDRLNATAKGNEQ